MDLDVAVLGTGLTESIVAAALSKAGYKVGHLDANPYYGADDASLSVDELVQWADERTKCDAEFSPYISRQRERFTDISYSGTVPAQSRQYALSLCPTIVPSVGPLIDSLIASGVSRYGGFKLLERVALYESPGVAKPVPGNKEDIFKDKQLSLLHKRRLMRFLMFAGGEFEDKPELQGHEQTPFPTFLKEKFSLDDTAVRAIAYAIAFCASTSDPTLPALHRIRRYLRSTGRYGPSPFLFGHYGGIGEIAQGFCRTAAVAGATYVLGRQVISTQVVEAPPEGSRKYRVTIDELSEHIECDVLISSADYTSLLPSRPLAVSNMSVSSPGDYPVARCIAILDCPLAFTGLVAATEPAEDPEIQDSGTSPDPQSATVDTAVLVFPPGTVSDGSQSTAVHVLVTGEGSVSAPGGKWVIYLSMPLLDEEMKAQTPEQLLRPYLNAALTITLPHAAEDRLEPLFMLFYKQHPTTVLMPSDDESPPLLPDPSIPLYLPEMADSSVHVAEATFWRAIEQLKAADVIDSFWPPLDVVEEEDEW
ncbi:hypothetical protein PHLGIDRAFT_22209 [Phlebiopsis gigantea 11061_1 CR5-6]|uniref:Rab proteins geranylgeranyltransferase n=1 Tax=Phlebiopsis gigantea (strain 11061_1 CR5-6) TaxID=745531 RepID=A0A0C3SEK3_PHLG1|nr:hypothetical protein PHLGIDRAFT_22209 [Phlebiopsis gigantea 11061_1 CR5-6]